MYDLCTVGLHSVRLELAVCTVGDNFCSRRICNVGDNFVESGNSILHRDGRHTDKTLSSFM